MPPRLVCNVSDSVWRALQDKGAETGGSLSRVVDQTLSTAFELDRHSLFQVSTSNALVQGVFRGSVTVGDLRTHGDFGLGTFDGLDGELIMLEGTCHRATFEGSVTVPDDTTTVPFAVITRFNPDIRLSVGGVGSLAELTAVIDRSRPSANLFVGIRVDGAFRSLAMRAACPAAVGEGLVEAVSHQSEFRTEGEAGTLVGFWAPTYARAVNIPGYHFHFISDDRSHGGHVLELEAEELAIGIHVESALHLAIPETAEFLTADLSGEHEAELARAETGRPAPGEGSAD